jgi:DNA polymerase-3 subunit delta'
VSIYPWLRPAWKQFHSRFESGQIAHAQLLQGPQGTGKLSLALAMAARLLCTGSGEAACGECRSCQVRIGGAHPDYFPVYPAEGKDVLAVDQVREMIGRLTLTTSFSARKVALIHPAEAMNASAANALLKSLEEPPGETVLILVSHDASRLPVTIRSRCQSIAIPLPGKEAALEWLVETAGLDAMAAGAALTAGGGSPLRARELVENGQVEQHQALLRTLAELLARPGLASKVAADWAEIDANALWAWLSHGCAQVLRCVMSGTSADWLEGAPLMNPKSVAGLQQVADRNRMLAVTPVRQDLLLREWLIRWTQLGHHH